MLHLWLLGQHVHNHLDLKIFTGGGLETEKNGFMNLKLFTVNKITPSLAEDDAAIITLVVLDRHETVLAQPNASKPISRYLPISWGLQGVDNFRR